MDGDTDTEPAVLWYRIKSFVYRKTMDVRDAICLIFTGKVP